MKMPVIVLGIASTLVFIVLVVIIYSLVSLVGMGDGFWTVGIVQLAICALIVAISCWLYVIFYKNES